jgi:hypothetical protein
MVAALENADVNGAFAFAAVGFRLVARKPTRNWCISDAMKERGLRSP